MNTVPSDSLLGSLVSGAAFGGLSLVDLALIIAAVVILWRLLSGRNRFSKPPDDARLPPPSTPPDGTPTRQDDLPGRQWAESQWARLGSQPASGDAAPGAAQHSPSAQSGEFDEADFLRGAKVLYARLQEAWDQRDLDDIAQFTTPEALAELERAAQDDPEPTRTEILLLDAKLLNTERRGSWTTATVRYEALLKEHGTNASGDSPEKVREEWVFRRDDLDPRSTWTLTSMRRLDDAPPLQ